MSIDVLKGKLENNKVETNAASEPKKEIVQRKRDIANIGIEKILFDCISAISNTGFSLADPSELNSVGSSILIVLMYIGRIGPLSLVLAFVHKDNRQKFVEYPEEKVIL